MESEELQMIGSQVIWKTGCNMFHLVILILPWEMWYVVYLRVQYWARNCLYCNVSPVLTFILFADDTNIFCPGSDLVQLSIIVSNELDKLNKWFAVNKLSLNLSKTNFILFANCRRDTNVNISINNCEIDTVYKTKSLGVVIDSKLNWKYHVAMVKSKLSKTIAIMHKAKHLLARRYGMILYFSLFLPYLSHCCEVWGNTYSSNIKNVYILQKKLYESCVMLITSTLPMYFS